MTGQWLIQCTYTLKFCVSKFDVLGRISLHELCILIASKVLLGICRGNIENKNFLYLKTLHSKPLQKIRLNSQRQLSFIFNIHLNIKYCFYFLHSLKVPLTIFRSNVRKNSFPYSLFAFKATLSRVLTSVDDLLFLFDRFYANGKSLDRAPCLMFSKSVKYNICFFHFYSV